MASRLQDLINFKLPVFKLGAEQEGEKQTLRLLSALQAKSSRLKYHSRQNLTNISNIFRFEPVKSCLQNAVQCLGSFKCRPLRVDRVFRHKMSKIFANRLFSKRNMFFLYHPHFDHAIGVLHHCSCVLVFPSIINHNHNFTFWSTSTFITFILTCTFYDVSKLATEAAMQPYVYGL